MFLRRIVIENFRGLCGLSLDLDDTTLLIGSNNTGKTSILEAVQLCMSRQVFRRTGGFADYDFHLPDANAQPQDAPQIKITLTFEEQSEGQWPDTLVQVLKEVVNITDSGLQSVVLNVTGGYDSQSGEYSTFWEFLNPAGAPLPKGRDPRSMTELQRLVPVFYLAALRDAAQQFRPQSPFWGPFVRSLKMDTSEREAIEAELRALNQKVLDAHEAFGIVREHLKGTGKIMPLSSDDPVCLEALPAKIFDMLSRTQVLLTGKSGARLPIARHGDGTQSLAVICLFRAFLLAKLTDGYGADSEPILALEEPEAHLHPSAIRAVGTLLSDLPGQKIIATHSGDLVASAPITALRRLCRVNGVIMVHRVQPGSLSSSELRQADHHVRQTRGSLLFARFWLLVEGETEVHLLQECARILGYDLFSAGVCCIDFQRSAGPVTLLRLANQLGIDWMLLADGDGAGNNFVKSAANHLNGRQQQAHIRQLCDGTIELYLCTSGFGHLYEANVSQQKKHLVTAPPDTRDYWLQVLNAQSNDFKLEVAMQVIASIEAADGDNMPELLRSTIESTLLRAGAAE